MSNSFIPETASLTRALLKAHHTRLGSQASEALKGPEGVAIGTDVVGPSLQCLSNSRRAQRLEIRQEDIGI